MQKVLILAAALVIAPLAVQAAAPDYNYLDLGFSKASISTFSGGKGYQLDGSYSFANYWFVAASYGRNNFSGGALTGGFFTTDEVLTVGGHLALTDSLDLVGRVAYASDRWKQGPSTNLFPGFSVSTEDLQDGYAFGFGIRAMLLDQLELNAFIDRNNAGLMSHDHTRAETTASVGAMYKMTDDFGLGLSYARGTESDASNWMLTGRWYFQPNQ
jgi:long-subunit fatty acid transport protein